MPNKSSKFDAVLMLKGHKLHAQHGRWRSPVILNVNMGLKKLLEKGPLESFFVGGQPLFVFCFFKFVTYETCLVGVCLFKTVIGTMKFKGGNS